MEIWHIWIIAALVFVIIEIFTSTFAVVCLSVGCVGGAIAGLGGLYFVMDYTTGAWTNNGFGDRGWLAIAIVIFALWRPKSAILSSYIFGGLYIASVFISGLSGSTKELIKMLPYLVTIIVLVFTSSRKKREHQPPAALGQSYFREER